MWFISILKCTKYRHQVHVTKWNPCKNFLSIRHILDVIIIALVIVWYLISTVWHLFITFIFSSYVYTSKLEKRSNSRFWSFWPSVSLFWHWYWSGTGSEASSLLFGCRLGGFKGWFCSHHYTIMWWIYNFDNRIIMRDKIYVHFLELFWSLC